MQNKKLSKTAAAKLLKGEAMELIYNKYGKPREDALRKAIATLTPEQKALAERGRDNFEAHYDELKQISYFLTNKDIGHEANYLPMLRLGDGTRTLSEEEQAKQILQVNGANITIAKADNGMTIERLDILPWHQGDIEADFFKLITKGLEREEHFKTYGALIRDFNEIFRGKSNESKELQEKIKIMHGNAAMESIGTGHVRSFV